MVKTARPPKKHRTPIDVPELISVKYWMPASRSQGANGLKAVADPAPNFRGGAQTFVNLGGG